MDDDIIRALEAEREGYKRRGLDDRVKQVDAILRDAKKARSKANVGVETPEASDAEVETA